MLKIEKILCPLDFSEFSEKAYDYAESLARRYEARLLLQHVVQPLSTTYPYYAVPEAVNDIIWDLESQAEKKLAAFVAEHQRGGLKTETFVHKGFVTDSILTFAENQGVNLIVMGTHGRHGFDRMAMGSATEKVLRKARCPVLVVRKPTHDFVRPGDAVEPVHLRKILFCTDFSEHSTCAFGYALSLAMEYNAELTLLHVLEDLPSTEDLETALEEVKQKLEKQIPEDSRNWCTARTAVRVGKPYQQILQMEHELGADLIVVGVRGRSVVDLALFGSTTYRVIQLGSSPVLVVHVQSISPAAETGRKDLP